MALPMNPNIEKRWLADIALGSGFGAVSEEPAVFLRGRGDFLYRWGKLQSCSCRLS